MKILIYKSILVLNRKIKNFHYVDGFKVIKKIMVFKQYYH